MSLTLGLQYEDRLLGAENFIPWEERVTLLLEELGLWEITKEVYTIPSDPILLDDYNRMNVKAR